MWIKQPDSICRLGLGTLRTETLITGDTPCVLPLVKGDALVVFFSVSFLKCSESFQWKTTMSATDDLWIPLQYHTIISQSHCAGVQG